MPEVLSSDSDDDSLEYILKKEQQRLKALAQSTVFQGKTRRELFKEARMIDRQTEKAKANHNWKDLYFLLFLFIEIVLKNNLHKPVNADETDSCMKLKVQLGKVETRLAMAKRGMQFQYEKIRDEEAAAAAAFLSKQKQQSSKPSAVPTKSSAMTPAEINAALDALRLPGQSMSSFNGVKSTLDRQHHPPPPPLLKVEDDPPPPSYAKVMTMSSQTSMSEQEITTLRVLKVTGDGSCAFRSIAQGMHQGTLSPLEEKAEADRLRKVVVKLLALRGREEMSGTGMTIEQVCLMKDENFENFASYCAQMAKSAYAGETEFWLLAEELNVRISIFMQGAADDENGLEHMITYGTNEKVPPICLFWQRGAVSEMGNHYDCLLQG